MTGLNEAVELLGMDILEEEGQDFVIEVLKLINEKINEANKKYKSPHNVEQVPAENSAVKLVQKDKYLGFNAGDDIHYYSNQFIPLTTNASMLERIRLQNP